MFIPVKYQFFHAIFNAVIVDSRFDGIFCQYRAVYFNRWQVQLFNNIHIVNGQCLVNRFAFQPFCSQR